jgi:hypothetical protein
VGVHREEIGVERCLGEGLGERPWDADIDE